MSERPDSVAGSFAAAVNTPLPFNDQDSVLEAPRTPFLTPQVTPSPLSYGAETPLPGNEQDSLLEAPRASYFAGDFAPSLGASFRDSYTPSTPRLNDSALLPAASKAEVDEYPEEQAHSRADQTKPRRRLLIVLGALAALVIVILAVVIPVYFTVIKPKSPTNGASSDGSPDSSGDTPVDGGSSDTGNDSPTSAITGGDGSVVTTEDGSTFTYANQFGGYCECYP